MAKFNIITINGGGVYGAIYARWLTRLSSAVPNLVPSTNLLSGTSIGGIVALALASGQSPLQVDSLFGNASELFTRSCFRETASLTGTMAKWDNDGRQSVLTSVLGQQTLSRLQKPVAIQTFLLNGKPQWRGQLLNSRNDADTLAVDAGMATSAAPYYFPTWVIQSGGNKGNIYRDGGMVANDPTMGAITYAVNEMPTAYVKNECFDNLAVLNIGLTYPGDTQDHSGDDQGWLSLTTFLDMMATANPTPVRDQAGSILGGRYFSLNALLPKGLGETAIDDYTAVGALQSWADQTDLSGVITWIGMNW